MPIMVNELDDLSQLKPNQYAWTTSSDSEIKIYGYTLINHSKIFAPWRLTQNKKN